MMAARRPVPPPAGLASIRLAVAALVVGAACTTSGALGPTEPPGTAPAPSFRQEDRVLLTPAATITGIAVSRRFVFAATPRALLVYDRRFERWLRPVALASSGVAVAPAIIAADPMEDGVWIGQFALVTYYQPLVDFATTTTVPGAPDLIFFDARDPGQGAFVRSGGLLFLVSRTGVSTQADPSRIPPPGARQSMPTLRDVYRQYPSLESFQGLLLRDERGEPWPVTVGAPAPDRSEVWLGTRGGGLFRVDPLFNRAEHMPFGLIDAGAGALALSRDGVWIGGLGVGGARRSGLTFTTSDLQHWQWLEGPALQALAGARAYALLARGPVLWVATDRGLLRLDTRTAGAARTWTLAQGLPDDRALALASAPHGVWVGTPRGLAVVRDSVEDGAGGHTAILAPGVAVRALLALGDTLWIGSDAGLLWLAGSDTTLRRPTARAGESALDRPVVALAASDTEVVVATDRDLVRLSARDGRLLPRYTAAPIPALDQITRLAMDRHTLWVAGTAGLLVIARADGVFRVYTRPRDLPGQVYDMVLDDAYAWLATPVGVVRLRRLAGGFPR